MPGRPFGNTRYAVGWGVIVLIALGSAVVHVQHALSEPELALLPFLLGIVLPMGIALLLLFVAIWLTTQDFDPDEMLTIGAWAGIGFLVFFWVGSGMMFFYIVRDIQVYDPVNVVVITGSTGALAGALLGLYDIRSRRATVQFKTQRDRAEQLTERMSILSRVFRHDIRTELTVIHGHARIAANQVSGSAEDHLETIVDRADSLERLSEQVRTVQTTVDQATTRKAQDVCAVLRSVQGTIEARNPEATIEVSCPKRAITEASVKLQAAFEEVLKNAIEHGDPEGIEVTVEPTESTVRISIQDRGPGIPEAEIEILESAAETPLQHSSGLGLWTVKWIVESSFGTLDIEQADPGTRIVMEVPRADPD